MKHAKSPLTIGLSGLIGVFAPSAPVVAEEACRVEMVDVAPRAGLAFRHSNGARGEKHLPETMGAGLAWLDYDGDGLQDLYLVQSGPYPPDGSAEAANQLYRNLGGGRFENVTDRSGAGDRGCGQGATAADFNGDGAVDLYVTNIGTDTLLLNLGDGRFDDATAATGLGLDGWSSSAALADADADGDLDLYVSRYVVYDPDHGLYCGDPQSGELRYCDPSLFEGAADELYLNELGDGGLRFRQISVQAGITPAAGRGLGVLFADLDGDFLADLYVANDLDPNFLFANLGGNRFEDLSLVSGTAVNRDGKPEAGMGVALADVDGDLEPELAVTNFDVETNTLYRNYGELNFSDVAAVSGFGLPSFNRLAFGIAAADLDLDGAIDYFIANGHIFEKPNRENVSYRQPDQILLGDGTGRFEPARCGWLGSRLTVARGLAVADFDNDGDVDVAIQENDGPVALLENRSRTATWLGVELHGKRANRQAIGARAMHRAERPQVRWVVAGDSYQSSSDRRLLFGVGSAPGADLEITWPGGKRQLVVRPRANRYLHLFEG